MITYDDILKSNDVQLYADELICAVSTEDNTPYCFSKRGLPCGSREIATFLRNRNFSDAEGNAISGSEAMDIIEKWKAR